MRGKAGQAAIVYHHRTQGGGRPRASMSTRCARPSSPWATRWPRWPCTPPNRWARNRARGFTGPDGLPDAAPGLRASGIGLQSGRQFPGCTGRWRPIARSSSTSATPCSTFAGQWFPGLPGYPWSWRSILPLARERSRHGGLVLGRLAQRLETLIANRAARVIAVSGVLRRMLAEKGAEAERIVVMHNGVNPEEFATLAHSRDTADGAVGFGVHRLVSALARPGPDAYSPG